MVKGAQYFQMGKYFMDTEQRFQYWMTLLDRKFQKLLGVSLVSIIYDSNQSVSDKFDRICYSHPALFMVQYSMAMTLIDHGIMPDYLFGISLGELVSLAVGHALELDEVIKLIVMQAEGIESSCREGGMLTVLTDTKRIEKILKDNSNCCLVSSTANMYQIVSGYLEDFEVMSDELKHAQIVFQKNAVKYGFHSHAIDDAKEKATKNVKSHIFMRSRIPVMSAYSEE